jgi:hypothetical protein
MFPLIHWQVRLRANTVVMFEDLFEFGSAGVVNYGAVIGGG